MPTYPRSIRASVFNSSRPRASKNGHSCGTPTCQAQVVGPIRRVLQMPRRAVVTVIDELMFQLSGRDWKNDLIGVTTDSVALSVDMPRQCRGGTRRAREDRVRCMVGAAGYMPSMGWQILDCCLHITRTTSSCTE